MKKTFKQLLIEQSKKDYSDDPNRWLSDKSEDDEFDDYLHTIHVDLIKSEITCNEDYFDWVTNTYKIDGRYFNCYKPKENSAGVFEPQGEEFHIDDTVEVYPHTIITTTIEYLDEPQQ